MIIKSKEGRQLCVSEFATTWTLPRLILAVPHAIFARIVRRKKKKNKIKNEGSTLGWL